MLQGAGVDKPLSVDVDVVYEEEVVAICLVD